MQTYKCLFVDWHLTLSNSIFCEHLSSPMHPRFSLFEYMQATLFQPSGFDTWLFPWMRGERTSEQVIAAICQRTTFDPALVLRELMFSCQRMQLISPAIPLYIAQLRARGLQVVIATDNMDTFQRWTVPSLRLDRLFDGILCSYQLRALKADVDPDGQSRFFASYLHQYAIGRGESLLLDDGDEAFGDVIRQFGIAYQHIQPGKGLVPALQTLLATLQ